MSTQSAEASIFCRPKFPNIINQRLGVKSCTKCGSYKSLSEFNKDSQSTNGYSNQCKDCYSQRRSSHFGRTQEGRRQRYDKEKSRAGVLLPENIICSKCGEEKSATAFNKLCVSKTGRDTRCKVCTRKYHSSLYRKSEEHRKRTIKRSCIRNRQALYGISQEQFEARLIAQDGKCAVCMIPLDGSRKTLVGSVDHNHKTGQIRGILCSQCNTALGLLKEDLKIFQRAISYLSYHGGV